MPPCTYPTLVVRRFPTLTLPVTTSSAVIFSSLHNIFAPTLTNCPYPASESKPHRTSHLTFTLSMTTHTPTMTNAIAPLAFPSRSLVINSTPSYTAPTLPPSLTLPSSALPTLFADMTSALDPHTLHSNKLLFSLDPAPLNSFANTTKHGLTLSPLCAHHIYSLQSHVFILQPSASPRSVQPPTSSPASPPSDDTQCQVCQVFFR